MLYFYIHGKVKDDEYKFIKDMFTVKKEGKRKTCIKTGFVARSFDAFFRK